MWGQQPPAALPSRKPSAGDRARTVGQEAGGPLAWPGGETPLGPAHSCPAQQPTVCYSACASCPPRPPSGWGLRAARGHGSPAAWMHCPAHEPGAGTVPTSQAAPRQPPLLPSCSPLGSAKLTDSKHPPAPARPSATAPLCPRFPAGPLHPAGVWAATPGFPRLGCDPPITHGRRQPALPGAWSQAQPCPPRVVLRQGWPSHSPF